MLSPCKLSVWLLLLIPCQGALQPSYDLATPPGSGAGAPNVRAFGENRMGRSTLAMDFNGDGFSDLVTATETQIYVWLGKAAFAGEKSFHSYYGLLPDLTLAGMTATGSLETADLNGDGRQDLIIGRPTGSGAGRSRENSGEARVVFGKATLPTALNLDIIGSGGADLTVYGASAGDKLTGNSNYGMRGFIRSGDLNGDGVADLILGAREARGPSDARVYSGELYVVFGRASFPATLDLATAGPTGASLTLYAPAGSYLGENDGCTLADLNADGVIDLIVGSPHNGRATDSAAAGRVHIVFGRKNPSSFPATLDLAISGAGGADVTVYGAVYNYMIGDDGSIATGDVDGDGIADLVVGSEFSNGPEVTAYYLNNPYLTRNRDRCGAAHVIFGRRSFPSTVDLLVENSPSSHVVIHGPEKGDAMTGGGALTVADLNGDGRCEIIMGAPNAKGPANARMVSGEIHIVSGRPSFPAILDLAQPNLAGVTTLYGASAAVSIPRLGMMKAADLDGDGFKDLVINANGVIPAGTVRPIGALGVVAYIVNGRASFPATLDLTVNGNAGASTTLLGSVAGNILTRHGISFGDFNGDGGTDLLLASLQATHYEPRAATSIPGEHGEAYVIYGGAPATVSPEIQLLHADGTDIPSGTSLPLGIANVGVPTFGTTLKIRNTGTGNLQLGALTLGGAHPGDFTAAATSNLLGPGLETELKISYTPAAAGPRNAILSLANDDADENPFILQLTAIGNTPYDDWAKSKFGTQADVSSVIGFDQDPDGDGISNAMEYVFGTDRRVFPQPTLFGPDHSIRLELRFSRTFLRTDVILEAQAAESPAGPWERAAISTGAQLFIAEPGFTVSQQGPEYQGVTIRDRVDSNAAGSTKRFMRLVITRK